VTLLFYKITAGILIFLITLLAVLYPIRSRALPKHHRPFELADAFASGIFLGTALFHMLPHAIRAFSIELDHINYPIAELFCAAGFLLLLFLERLSRFITMGKHSENTFSYLLAMIFILHSLIEGTVLGVNLTLTTTAVIFIAIIAHKGSESFALAVVLNRSHLSFTKMLYLIILFSLMTPLGILSGTLLTHSFNENAVLFTASFNAFAAGSFLYMSTLHHINHHERHHDKENLFEFAALLAGLMVMGLLAGWT
jgi:zinc transporter ZupT